MNRTAWSRRHFIAGGIPAAVVMLAGNSWGSDTGRTDIKSQPNIILIFSDSHRADVTGCSGNKIVQTPNLDNLARRGVVFENCYCSSPLCGPSRNSFTAGKYSSRVNVWNNNYELPDPGGSLPTLPRIMNAAGYESYYYGHMDYPPTNSYGFNKLGKGGRQKTREGQRRDPDDLKPKAGYSKVFDGSHEGDDSRILNGGREATTAALDFLKNRKNGGKPFFLLMGYAAPHYPFTAPAEYYAKYKGKIPAPEIPAGYLDSLPLNYKHLRIAFNNEDVPDDVACKSRELYYALTEWFDNEVGKVLTALNNTEFADNTVVIYSSDHAENLGEHGLWLKNAMYDSATRVPLIVSWPERWGGGQRRQGACSLLDVTRTIADIARAKVPADWNGDSLVPWLDDPKHPWKDLAVSEYYAHNIASGYAMIRTGNYKYVYHTPADSAHPAEQELYNLAKDPGELDNLAGNPEYKQQMDRMHAALAKEVGEDPEKIEQRCRADYNKNDPVKK